MTEQFGIRSLEFSPEFGFKLNGKKIFLQGNANHHDLGALGATCYDKAIERMMLQLKSFGYNCIRCSHNPYSDKSCPHCKPCGDTGGGRTDGQME